MLARRAGLGQAIAGAPLLASAQGLAYAEAWQAHDGGAIDE
jgi:hypothetical protein